MCGHRRHHRQHHFDVEPPGRATTIVANDEIRASDAERERVVTHLRAQAGEGRLTVEELDERLERVYAARTRADLNALVADLPKPRRPRPDPRAEFHDHLRTYLWVMALLVAIWAFSGMGAFWPIWPALGWGIAIAIHGSTALRTPRRRAAPGL